MFVFERRSPSRNRILEGEDALQINRTICGVSAWPAPTRSTASGEAVGHAELRRSQGSNRRRQVYVIKDIANVDAHGEVKTPCVSVSAAASTQGAAARTPKASASGAARSAPSAPSPASLRSRRALPSFTAEAERLGNPQVEGKLRGASKRVDRNKRLAGCGLGIESAKWSAVNAPVNACCRTSVRRDEARPLVEQCGTNQVLAQGNVVGPSGTEHHEGAEAERPRHADCPADKGSVSDIKGGPAIVCEYVVRVGRESVDSSR